MTQGIYSDETLATVAEMQREPLATALELTLLRRLRTARTGVDIFTDEPDVLAELDELDKRMGCRTKPEPQTDALPLISGRCA